MRQNKQEYYNGLPLAAEASDEMLWYTVWLAFVIGCVLSFLSWRGRQWWLLTWSLALILCSSGYLSWAWLVGRTV